MRRLTILCGLLLALLALTTANIPQSAAAQEMTATPSPTATSNSVPLYGRFEARIDITETGGNPYDPSLIDLNVTFTSPSGKQIIVPGFWMQPYNQTCTTDCAMETLETAGAAGWYVRFSPTEIGTWSYVGQAKLADRTSTTRSEQFEVVESQNRGFIRVGENPRYFGYDSGDSYFPVGSNLGWSWDGYGGTLTYLSWLKRLHEVGANYGRLYIDVPWFIGLDWHSKAGNYDGAQQDGWRLDEILKTAEQYGIALQIVLVWHQGYTTYAGAPVNIPTTPARPSIDVDWNSNPLSVVRGGPLPNAISFFTTERGRNLLKQRLRYIAARWGYSTSVFAWEMIDQLDRVVDTDAASAWLTEMRDYLRTVDVNAHLITAGVRDPAKQSLLDAASLDFRMTRYYQRRPIEDAADQVTGALNLLNPLLASGTHPALLTEFSLGPWFEPAADDPTGVHVTQTMWATALSGAGGAGSSWWWDTYLFPSNVVNSFGGLAAFTRGINWASGDIQSASVQFSSNFPLNYQPFTITGFGGANGEPSGPDVAYRVTPDGVFPPIAQQSAFIYGLNVNAQMGRPQRYLITPPVDTVLTITVRRVSDQLGAHLVVRIDGQQVGEADLPPRSVNSALTVPITAGEHEVVIDNVGQDFLQLESIVIGAYIAPVRTVALADRQQGVFLAWAQLRDYTWQSAALNRLLQPVLASLHVDHMPSGLYSVELWDPLTGNVIGEEQVQVFDTPTGKLTIDLLPLNSMIAVRAVRIAEPANLPTLTPAPTSTPRFVPSITPTVEPTATIEVVG
ncbi:MAG: DUF5060 domain-containing protein [Anaerolineae bacterium]|nr:DUF5060 domain-containing protein [Anaerolineae bacterium]